MSRFKEKVILISGSARGIGAATAELFAREGATVIVTDCNVDEADESIATLINEGFNVEADALDVTKENDWERVIDNIIKRYQRLDVLVNNAGVIFPGSVEDAALEEWRTTMAVNVEGVFIGTRKAIKVMKNYGGAIINVASISGIVGDASLAAYNASKGGVTLLTKSSALHCAERGYNIRVNSIHPGHTLTKLVSDFIESIPEEERGGFVEKINSMIPMKRPADPMEIAKPILFLASDDASYMTGSELVVDGGYTTG